MNKNDWIREFPAAITVCDKDGVILQMNDEAVAAFREQGGATLIGTNLLDRHPEPARTKLKTLLQNQQMNVYTIEKKGAKKLIYQAPWYRDGRYSGLAEVALEIPEQMPHFVREK